MKKFISVLIGKLVLFVGNFVGRSSSLPGHIARKIDNNILSEFVLPKNIIAVTGSSGKGSTTKMIADIYKKAGYSVAHNYKGANLIDGVITTCLEYSNFKGHIKKDVMILEVDERYAKYIFPIIKPKYVVVSNISRDQPPRQGHFDIVFNEIKKALTPDMHLILNGDDPYLMKFNLNKKFKVTYYGIDKNKYSTKKNNFTSLNITRCPKCNSELNYNYYHFETIGDYYCSKCSFKRPKIDYLVTDINYDKFLININDTYEVHIPYNVLYCVYNTIAAFTVCSLMKLDEAKTAQTISDLGHNKKNYNHYTYKNREVYVLNNKNENSTTFNQSLLFLNRYKDKKTIVIGWKEISRRYNFDDLSWLYDIDFEILSKHEIDRVICVGIHRYDIAERIKYAGVDQKKIFVYENLDKAKGSIKKRTNGNIYAILNFDYIIPFNKIMNEGDDA
jgi:UDP-N-acetylmuramyl tripeptide synthase